MNKLEKHIIEAAQAQLKLLRFSISDPQAAIEIEQSAKDLDLTVSEALHIDRSIRMNHIEALTALADGEDTGLSETAVAELKNIAKDSRSLERTAIWTSN